MVTRLSVGRLHHSLGPARLQFRTLRKRVLWPVRCYHSRSPEWPQKALRTLAIETSCDDTSTAVLVVEPSRSYGDGSDDRLKTRVVHHERITAPSEGYGGIHPLIALHSHQQNLARSVRRATEALREHEDVAKPDLVAVTRGPGMRSNLSVGLDTAKGLALAWDVPLVGVHHMQAHALTARLCNTLRSKKDPDQIVHRAEPAQVDKRPELLPWTPETLQPAFPFLSVLVSGGHTLLIESKGLVDHSILAESSDIAIGECLDKAARAILPPELLLPPFGRALEMFAFSEADFEHDYEYTPPLRRGDEVERRVTQYGWGISPPFSQSKSGGEKSSRRMAYSFAGVLTYVQQLMAESVDRSLVERRMLAREVMRVVFEHLTSRILIYLASLDDQQRRLVKTVVVSGGVACNSFLRHVFRRTLDARGFAELELVFPPVELCTDNALMIAWTGMEMYYAGYGTRDLSMGPIRKWPMSSITSM